MVANRARPQHAARQHARAGARHDRTVRAPKALVRFFVERWAGSVHYVAERGRRRGYWRWRIAAQQAASFLRAIRPFIVSPRVAAKIDHGLDFQAQKAQRRSDEAYRAEQWHAYWYMAELNARGVAS